MCVCGQVRCDGNSLLSQWYRCIWRELQRNETLVANILWTKQAVLINLLLVTFFRYISVDPCAIYKHSCRYSILYTLCYVVAGGLQGFHSCLASQESRGRKLMCACAFQPPKSELLQLSSLFEPGIPRILCKH